jgi:hypothetical protein
LQPIEWDCSAGEGANPKFEHTNITRLALEFECFKLKYRQLCFWRCQTGFTYFWRCQTGFTHAFGMVETPSDAWCWEASVALHTWLT